MPALETEIEKENDPMLLVVGGALTMDLGPLSCVFRHFYSRLLDISENSLAIFPKNGGLTKSRSWGELNGDFQRKVDQHIEQRSPRSILFVGHSMGAALAIRYCAERPELKTSVVGVAGALGKVTLAFGKFSFGNPIKAIDKAFLDNTEVCSAMLESNPVRIHQVAADSDEVLHFSASLHDIPASERTLLTARFNPDLDPSINQITAQVDTLAHLNIVSHPETAAVVADELGMLREAA